MTTIEKIATAKAIKDTDFKLLSEQLAPGIYVVDTVIHLTGTVKKGEPFETAVAAAANPWRLLAKALSKLNSATIESLVRESLEVSDEEETEVKDQAKKAIEALVAKTPRTQSGRITGQLVWGLQA